MLRARDVMTPHPKTIAPANSLTTALRLMEKGGFHHLPVVEDGKLVGMLHVSDIRRHLGMERLPVSTEALPPMWDAIPVRNVMQPLRHTLTPDTPVPEILRLIEDWGVTGLPVVEDGQLVGIVTVRDLLQLGEQILSAVSARQVPPAVCFVGRSGSGKTSLIERLVPLLRGRGYAVGVVKQHAQPTLVDQEGKDTWRFEKVGANPVAIVSNVQTAVFFQEERPLPLDVVLLRFFSDVDVVLVEGFSHSDKPKIEVHRQARSDTLKCDPNRLLAVVTDRTWESLPCRQFDWDQVEALADFLEETIIRQGDAQ